MSHTVELLPTDAAVIVTASGDVLHLTTDDLAQLMNAAEFGNDMLKDDAGDMFVEEPERAERLADCATVDGQLQWLHDHTDVINLGGN